jgi:2,3-bisphosphoglycerate-dependent phosphoglycerate mutase
VRRDWRLNERHYGDLQGKNKAEIMAEFGEGTAQAVAPELRHPPPPLSPDNPWSTADDPRYRDVDPSDIPLTECLADVVVRVLPYWEAAIVPDLRWAAETNSAVLVAAHGNSIRALRKHLEGISTTTITELEIPTGIPFRMLLNDDLTVHSSGYLGDPAAAAEAAAAVAARLVSRARRGYPVLRPLPRSPGRLLPGRLLPGRLRNQSHPGPGPRVRRRWSSAGLRRGRTTGD